jgi:hypothetical protein
MPGLASLEEAVPNALRRALTFVLAFAVGFSAAAAIVRTPSAPRRRHACDRVRDP